MLLKRILTIALISVCVAGAWFAYARFQRTDVQLSVAPKNFFNSREFVTKPSSMSVNIRLPFKQLSAKANGAAPKEYRGQGVGKRKCKRVIGIKACGTPQYDYVVTRGDIAVAAGPANSIRITVPLAVTGHGGYQGKGAKLFGLQSKNFKASLRAVSDISLVVAKDWCPKPSIRADFEWVEGAKVELFSGVWVSVRSLVEPRMREKIAELSDSVAGQIDCKLIQSKLRQVWTNHTSPIKIGDTEQPLHLNISPQQIAFSGLKVDPQAVNLVVQLVANAQISEKPADTEPLALPALRKTEGSKKSVLAISLPMFVPYQQVKELIANRLMKEPISTDTAAGTATITTREVNVYPSGDQLVIAALMNIDLPTSLLDVSGWVYLKTTPKSQQAGSAIKLSEPTFSRDVDSQLWRLVSVVLENTVKQSLDNWGVIDLKKSITKAKARLAKQVAKPRQGFTVKVGDPQIRLGEIAVTANQLVIETIFRSRADIEFSGL